MKLLTLLSVAALTSCVTAQQVIFPPIVPLSGGQCGMGIINPPLCTAGQGVDLLIQLYNFYNSFPNPALIELFSLQASNSPPPPQPDADLTVTVGDLGTTTGVLVQNGAVAQYNSVPYAACPIRWQMPIDSPVFGAHDGTVATPECVEADGITGVEDGCLWVTINVPTNTTNRPADGWPVFVYLPGGSFVNNVPNDMSNMTAQNSNFIGIFTTYRTGPYGYLALKGISKEMGSITGIEGSGGIETLDQQSALRWVQRHIVHFGGDKNKVTVGGTSAGSWSTCLLLSSPLSKGLFHQAILESGNCDGGPATLVGTLDHQEEMGQSVASHAGCDLDVLHGNYTQQLICMRGITQLALSVAANHAGQQIIGLDHMSMPCVDGYVQRMPPQQAFWSGEWNAVPLLAGSCLFESYIFNLAYNQNTPGLIAWSLSQELLANWTTGYGCNKTVTTATAATATSSDPCAAVDPDAISKLAAIHAPTGVFQQYPPALAEYYSANTLGTEGILVCGMRRLAEYATIAGHKSFLYNFRARGGSLAADAYGPSHTFEVYPVYGIPFEKFLPRETVFSDVMSAYWSNFVATGDANNSTGNLKAYSGRDRIMPSVISPLLLDGSVGPSELEWINWDHYNTDNHTSMQFGDHQIPQNYTLWMANHHEVTVQCPLWDRTMPGATDHNAVLFTPRPYTGYNQPGFWLPPGADRTVYYAPSTTATAAAAATDAPTDAAAGTTSAGTTAVVSAATTIAPMFAMAAAVTAAVIISI